jgi:predicted MPP superfamily phosphohydrolase
MKRHLPLLIFAIGMLVLSGTPVSAGDSYSYAFVHLSDVQHLSKTYPATLNQTFLSLESLKNSANISAIIITGDMVNDGDDPVQWNHYADARSLTTIPVYEIPGDEDLTDNANNPLFHKFVGNKTDWNAIIDDFVFIGIGYTENPLSDVDIAHDTSIIEGNPQKFTLIAVHNYYNKDFTVSTLGKSIKDNLVLKPTFVLSGHAHGQSFQTGLVNTVPYVVDLTNYQAEGNFSAGKLYTVYCTDGEVSKITVRNVYIAPRQYLDPEIPVYDRTGVNPYPSGAEHPANNDNVPSTPVIPSSPYSPQYFINPSQIISPVPEKMFKIADGIEDVLEERYLHDSPDENEQGEVIDPSDIIIHDYRAIFLILDIVEDHIEDTVPRQYRS